MSEEIFSQIDCFKAYLASGRAPRWTMQPTDLHGFLTSLAMAGSIPEEAWIPLVFSGEEPRFETPEEEWQVMSDLRAYAAAIRNNLGSYRLVTAADLPFADGGWFEAADWAEGFLQGIESNPGPWRRALHQAEPSLAIVLAPCYHNHESERDGLLSLEGMNELNYHLRHLNRIMQGTGELPSQLVKAA